MTTKATASRALTREAILATTLAQETVEVPEWGGAVIVRCLSGQERDAYDAFRFRAAVDAEHSLGRINNQNIRAKLAALSIVDEDGVRLFSEADVQALGEKDGAALDRIWNVAQRLSKLIATQADLEALVANLKARPSLPGTT